MKYQLYRSNNWGHRVSRGERKILANFISKKYSVRKCKRILLTNACITTSFIIHIYILKYSIIMRFRSYHNFTLSRSHYILFCVSFSLPPILDVNNLTIMTMTYIFARIICNQYSYIRNCFLAKIYGFQLIQIRADTLKLK